MNFKQVLQWIKHNPIAVGSAVLCLASLIFLLIVHVKGNSFIEEATNRAKEIKSIESFRSTPMKLPPEKVDASPRVVNAVVNQGAIDYLKTVFSQMQGDYSQIWDLAIKHNRGDAARGMHLPMMEGLFPNPGTRQDILFTAHPPYVATFMEMLGPASEGAQYPRLNAGRPVSRERIDGVIEPLERNLRARYSVGEGGLSPTQVSELNREKTRAVMDLLMQRARSIHIYATPDAFQIDSWNNDNGIPKLQDMWESQLNLWIQQDIVQTISRTNRVSDPNFSVIEAPIKRLNKIQVVPGYVGINSGGGLVGSSGYGTVVSGETKLRDDFSFSPTGRLSNTMYDVRHVWVDMDVDIQQLPVFMDELVQTNFMSVIKVEMTNVDEYKLLNEGYFLGSADVVNLHMLIETIWLRAWVTPMMPKAVRDLIGVPDITPGSPQASAQ